MDEQTRSHLDTSSSSCLEPGVQLSLTPVLEYLLDGLLRSANATVALLALPDEGHLVLACQRGLTAPQQAGWKQVLQRQRDSMLPRALFTSEAWPGGETEALWAELGVRRVLVLPLGDQEHLLGGVVLGLPVPLSPDKAGEKQITTMGNHLAAILGLERELHGVFRRLQESRALLDITQAVAQPQSGEELLNAIVRTAVESIPAAEAGIIHILDQDGETLLPEAIFRDSVPLTGGVRMRLGVGIAGEALQEGRTIRVNDVSQEPRFILGETRPAYSSLLVAPLELAGRKVGTLSAKSSRPAAFTADDERFLAILAGQAAMVVENNRLLMEQQQQLAELQREQARLVRSEKLAATGRLAVSIAHEINNPLEGIKNYLALLSHRQSPGDSNLELIGLVEAGFERIRNTVRQLLSISREQEVGRHPCDLREAVGNALAMVRSRLLAACIQVQEDLPVDLPWVLASPQQIEQVFLHLFLNAGDAMVEGGGKLQVRGWEQGRRVYISVRDTGPGIPETIRDRLFEPFVTTKREGTGLDLWASYGTIADHGGTIEVESEAGQGSTFTVTLPVLPR